MKTRIREEIRRQLNHPIEQRLISEPGMFPECKRAFDACAKSSHDGLVYFVQCGEYAKIGYTSATVASRILSFRTGSPHEFTALGSVKGDLNLEGKLHDIFRGYHHRCEWFRLEGALAEFVHSIRGRSSVVVNRKGWRRNQIRSRRLPHIEHEKLSLLTSLNS